jgi:hypothetical protein
MNRDEQLPNIKKHRENQVRSSYNDQKSKKIDGLLKYIMLKEVKSMTLS